MGNVGRNHQLGDLDFTRRNAPGTRGGFGPAEFRGEKHNDPHRNARRPAAGMYHGGSG